MPRITDATRYWSSSADDGENGHPAGGNLALSELCARVRNRPAPVFVGIGSNLDNPISKVRAGLAALAQVPHTRLVANSALYRNPPIGFAAQPDFVNAVAALETRLSPWSLLRHLQVIEARYGRVRTGRHWGPRTLDLDLLLYGKTQIETTGLTIPHPGLHERAFVLYPLYEISPDLEIPGHGPLRALLRCVSAEGLETVDF